MFLDEWGRWLRRLADQLHGTARQRTYCRARLRLELLEERVTPSSTAQIDSGGANGQFNTSDNISYHGGSIIDNVQIEPIFLKDNTTHNTSPNQAQVDGFFNTITSNSFIPNQLSPYDTGSYNIGTGSKGADDLNVPVSTDTVADGYASITDGNIENIITQEIAAGHTATPTANTLYFVFTPPGDAVGVTGSDSVNQFSGYHSSFQDGAANIRYAVIPDPGSPNNSALNAPLNQGGYGFTNAQVLTDVSSHEMGEAITDPDGSSWYNTPLGGGGEIGDQAAFQAYTLDGYMTQYMWENSIVGPGHAPAASGNTNNIFINQLTPPAVSGLSSFPVATFTDLNPANNLSNLTAYVDAIYPNTVDNFWTASITGGANGVYVVNAVPSPAITNGQYGLQAPTNYGLEVVIAGAGVTESVRIVPFAASTTAPLTYNAENNGVAHNFTLVQSGANLDLKDNGQVVFFQPISDTTSVVINADTGTDNSLTIDYSGGTFSSIHNISFDGGNGSAVHTLTVTGGSFATDVYSPTGANSGTLTFGSQIITFNDVGTVDDLSGSTAFTVSGTNGVDQINIGNGPTVNSTVTTQVSSANNTFPTVNFANKPTVTIKGLTGADTYTLNNATPAAGLTTLDLTAGNTAGVVFNIQATAASVTTNVLGGAANATANVGSANKVAGIAGVVNLDDTVASALGVVVNDSADTSAQTVTLTSGKIHGLAPADINYVSADTLGVTIDGGTGGNKFSIQSVSTGLTTTVNGGTGTNTFNVTPIASGANLTINGQGPTTAPGDKMIYGGNGTLNPSAPGAGTITQTGFGIVAFTGIATVIIGADPSQSTIAIAPANVVSGSTATVTLTARDGNGNQLTSGGLSVAFGLGAGTAQGTFSAVTDNGNGTYSATFTATIAGANTITGTIAGAPVTSTLPTVTVTPGSASPAHSTVSINPSTVAIGTGATITLQAKDASGNLLTTGGANVAFTLGTGAGSGTFGPVTDNHNGTYTATFTGQTIGSNTIGATINGQTVVATANVTVAAGAASLSQSTVSIAPASVASGGTATVTLQARDASGNNEPFGGLVVGFGVGGGAAGGSFSSVTDNHNGTYTATFTASAEGSNTITATIGGQAVTSTPPTVTVTQGPVSLAQSVVSAFPASVQAGSTTTVTLTAKDANGVTEPSGGLTVAFGLGAGAGAGTFSTVTDNGNGTYTATFSGTTAGGIGITATINGQAVTSTPPIVTVTPGAYSLAQSIVSLSPTSIPAGSATTVTLTAEDSFGNALTSGGLSVGFGLGAGNISGTFGAVTDHGNGTYTAVFTAGITVGNNTVTATIGGQSVTSTAPSLTVTAGPASLAQSTVAVAPGSVASGASTTVTLTTRDAFGNPELTGGLSVAFSLGAGAASGFFGAVTDNQNGTYTASFTGVLAGSNTITATIGGQFLTSAAPSVTVVPGAVSITKSVVSIAPGSVQAGGSTATVTLLTKDAAGNALTSGGLSVAFGLGAGSAQGGFSAFSDLGNGSYTAVFSGTIAGSNTITATIGGQAVTSTPPTVVVTPGVLSLSQSNVTLAPSTIAAAGTSTVTLTARDAFGNAETSGGLAVVFGLGAGSATGTFGAVTDHHNGTYTATFTAGTTVGSNTVTATIGGQAVTSTPPTLTVTPGAVSLSQSTIAAAPASIASGTGATVTLTARDAFGNQEQSGGLIVAFGLGGGSATGSFGPVADNHNGTYTATFTGNLEGSNTITATIGGLSVTSTAAPIAVTPGAASIATSAVSVVPGSVQAGQNSTVTLQAEDAAGNDETAGGLSVSFSLGAGSATGAFGAVTDNHNGTYTATFTGDLAGANSVIGSISSQPVTTAAPTITVTPGPLSLATSVVTLSPSAIPAAGATTVTLIAEDAFGNQEPTGGLSVAFGLGTGNISGNFSAVSDNHNGTYTATFTTGTIVGSNTVTATIGGSPITSAAPTLTVTPAVVNLGQSTIAVAPASIASGSTATVTLVARDAFGNQEATGGLTVTFGLGSGSATGGFSATTDNGNGIYTATFTGVLVGMNTITAAIAGNAVTSTQPGITVTPGPASTSLSFVTVAPASIQAGTSTTVTLHARDAAGNNETSGGLAVAFGLGAGNASGSFGATTDNGNGTYTATFTGDLAGTNTITATINAQGLTATPPTIAVTPAAVSNSQSVVTLTPATILAGGTTTVTLTAKDAFGNSEATGGLGVAFALGSSSIAGSFGPVTDSGTGTYTAVFTAGGLVGASIVTATIGGSAVTSTPPTLTVTPAVFSTSQSTLSVAPASIASGSTATVTLTAKDRFGNQEATGGLIVTFGLGTGSATGSFGATTDNGNGTYTATFTGVLAGSNTVTADIDSQAVGSTLPTLSVTPGPVSTAQSTVTIVPTTILVGGTVSVTLQAEDAVGNKETAGGLTVLFSLGAGTAAGTFSAVTDNHNGTYSAVFTGAVTGSSVVTAAIDAAPVTSTLPIVTVQQGNTTTLLTASTGSAVFGQTVTFTAAVAPVVAGFGMATGTVNFFDGATLLGSDTLTNGVATLSVSSLSVAGHHIAASYVGSTQFAASNSSLSLTVGQAATTIAVTGASSAFFGPAVTFTAAVSAVSPGAGTVANGDLVTFKDGGITLGTSLISGGTAIFNTGSLSVGTHTITAVFAGDTDFATSTGALNGTASNNFTLSPAVTVTDLASSASITALGQAITFTAVIAPDTALSSEVNSGFVKFLDGTTSLNGSVGAPVSQGVATFTFSGLVPGNHAITAVYSGAADFDASSSATPLEQSVFQVTSFTVTSSLPGGAIFGQAVTFTANLTISPPTTGSLAGGIVTFESGATILGTGTLAGSGASYTASYTTTASPTVQLGVGADSISAAYSVATLGTIAPRSSLLTQRAVAAQTTTTLSVPGASFFGQPVTLTAAVAANAPSQAIPTGIVTFKDGGTILGTGTLNAGVATFTTTSLAVGNQSISAVYASTASFGTSSSAPSSQLVSVASTQTAVTSSPNPSVYGQPVTLTATVTANGGGNATGTVTFRDGSTVLGKGVLNAAGIATYTTTPAQLALGNHSITAVYAGTAKAGFSGSTASASIQTVDPVDTTTTLTASSNWSLGAAVTFTASVVSVTGFAANSGTVTFVDTATGLTLGTANVVAGKAILHFAGFSNLGAHSVVATYNGAANFNVSNNAVPLSQNTVEVALSASASPVVSGANVTIYGFVAGDGATPVGSLSIYDGTKLLGILYLNQAGMVSLTLSNLTIGTHHLTAVYSGDNNYNPGGTAAPISVVVTPRTTGRLS